MRDSILSAIKKYFLKNEVIVYRGIHVSIDVYNNNFYRNYKLNKTITGSLICSTSRSLTRAIRGAYSQDKNEIAIVFEITLPKNYNALPVEDIALISEEEEIIISKPKYKIKDIKNYRIKTFYFKKIIVELERGNNHEN